MGYYGITFGMANLSDDLFTNFIVSSIIGVRTVFFTIFISELSMIADSYPRQSLHTGPLKKLIKLKDALVCTYDRPIV